MKKERYFREELQSLFFLYGVVPAALFTLVCGLVFMAALLYGRISINQENCRRAAGRLEALLKTYEECIEEISEQDWSRENEGRTQVFETFYRASDQTGYEAGLYILDTQRQPVITNGSLPSYLQVDPAVDWGIFRAMEEMPGQTVITLLEGWDSQSSTLVMGRAGKGGFVTAAIEGWRLPDLIDMQDTQMIIADRFGWVLLSNHYHFLTDSNQVSPLLQGGKGWLRDQGRIYLVSKQEIREGEFTAYSVSDIQNIIYSLVMGSGLVITALGLMTLWVSFSSRKVTKKKTEDLYHILEVLGQARQGNLEGRIRICHDNEFKLIADAYNETLESLKGQMENNRRMAELVALAQNKQLESQFNPHFLYNTLENIRYMCKLEPATAERMVFSLSNLLRYSLDSTRAEVTLREDLEHLTNYLTILERRFGSRFQHRIQVEPEALDCRIPKLVLQPMIENAVKYGYGDQRELKVELKAYVHEGKLTMICRDDGVGMAPALLGELTALLEQKENTSRHSGLYNIHRRILLLYGRPYGVEIRSTEGYGTTLIAQVPARKQEDKDASGIDRRG